MQFFEEVDRTYSNVSLKGLLEKKEQEYELVKKIMEVSGKSFKIKHNLDKPSIKSNICLTSKIAKDSLIFLGKNKKYRRKKSNIDKVSASIILQSYLQRNS